MPSYPIILSVFGKCGVAALYRDPISLEPIEKLWECRPATMYIAAEFTEQPQTQVAGDRHTHSDQYCLQQVKGPVLYHLISFPVWALSSKPKLFAKSSTYSTYMRSGAFMPRTSNPFLSVCLTTEASATLYGANSSCTSAICSCA